MVSIFLKLVKFCSLQMVDPRYMTYAMIYDICYGRLDGMTFFYSHSFI